MERERDHAPQKARPGSRFLTLLATVLKRPSISYLKILPQDRSVDAQTEHRNHLKICILKL